MSRSELPNDQVLTMLAEAPSRIATFTAGLTPAQLRTPPNPGEWSANDVLAHLRSCVDMWAGSIITLLAEDNPTIRAINPRTWIKKTDYPQLEFHASLQVFTKQRNELMAVLKPLTPEQWSRSGTFTGAGKPIVRTVQSFAERLAIHERPHIKQIKAIAETLHR